MRAGTLMDSNAAASALQWWQDAGVDTIVGETPHDWLAPAASKPTAARPAAGEAAHEVPEAASAPAVLPDSLDAFREWLLTGDVPLASPAAPRVGPTGDPACGLMIMIDMPSSDDLASGMLLSGEAGALFDRMLAAFRPEPRSRETIYLASMSPVRTATGMLDAAAAKAVAAVARHHVGLVAPKALLLFGDACAKALLGAPVARTRGKWHELDTPTGPIRTLVTIRPEKLVVQPALKKHAWEDLQLLMEGEMP